MKRSDRFVAVSLGVLLFVAGGARAETTVELPSGGSFAVAGLMQHNTKQVIDGFPGVKDLPVLGALFRSRDFADDQTELVVLVSAGVPAILAARLRVAEALASR